MRYCASVILHCRNGIFNEEWSQAFGSKLVLEWPSRQSSWTKWRSFTGYTIDLNVKLSIPRCAAFSKQWQSALLWAEDHTDLKNLVGKFLIIAFLLKCYSCPYSFLHWFSTWVPIGLLQVRIKERLPQGVAPNLYTDPSLSRSVSSTSW